MRPQTSLLAARRSPLAAVLATAVLVSLLVAAPAGAVVSEVIPGTTVGLQTHSAVLGTAGAEPSELKNASGNPVVHQSVTYAIYWDPTNDLYHGDWQEVINGFLANAGAASGQLESVFAVDTQYTDKTNVPVAYHDTFRGAYTDTRGYPSPGCTDPNALEPGDAITCITDKQIREELEHFISVHGLQKGMGAIYYLLTPPGVTVCVDAGLTASHCSSNAALPTSFCSYHSAINLGGLPTGDANTILYAAVPWTAGGLGDPLLLPGDRTSAFDCQDGGFDPSSKPAEKQEKAKERTKGEKEAFEKATNEEKVKLKKTEELEGLHQQEPNQAPCPTVFDGGCDTGLADIVINQIATERQNIVTDPLLNAWQDPKKNEVTDECRNVFARVTGGSVAANEESGAGTLSNQELDGHGYYLNDAFNLAAFRLAYPGGGCLNHVNLVPSFNNVNPVNAGDIVGFDGMQSNISLNAAIGFSAGGAPEPNYATYTWRFGDGTPAVSGFAPGAPACETPWLTPCAASVFHSYQYGGTYEVTLTVRDVGGNTASISKSVVVNGAGPPSPSQGASAAAGPGSGQGTPGGGSSAGVIVPNPVAAATIISRSLKTALRKGVAVRYSVNEQVTGRFEILLNRATARRLGIAGTPAVGLPSGSPAQLVIAKAILVTTKAGRSTVEIRFSPRTAARLRRVHKVTLMLRMVVRNASSRSPASTTVLSTVTLSG